MKPFAYERAGDAAGAVAAVRGADGRDVPRRRDEPRRPDAARRRARRRCLVDVARLPHDRIEETPDGGLRIGAAVAQQRPRRADRPCATAIRCSPQALLAGRVRAAAQPRDGRRQPAPAHALPVLPGRRQAVQQARARIRLPGARRATTATSRSSGTREPASRRTRPTWRSRWRRSAPRCTSRGRAGERTIADARAAPPAGRRAAARHRARAGRADHRRELPPPLDGARSSYRKVRERASFAFALVSVAAVVDVDGRAGARLPDRARRRRPRAVARRARRGRAARRARRRGGVRRAPPTRSSPPRGRCATTRTRSPLARNAARAARSRS